MIKSSFLFGLLSLIMSCAASQSWFNAPPSAFASREEVEKIDYCVIKDPNLVLYVEKLNDYPILEVEKVGSDLCGKEFEVSSELKTFVVRSLYIGKYTGDYIVLTDRTDLWINHESLAGSATPISKSALIIRIKHKPRNIYVTAYADE